MPTLPDFRVAVVGGGAAGFFAALNLAEKNPRARVTIFEAAHKPLQKVLISGGGRCNLTHACFDPVRLSEFYPRGHQELRSLFARFQPQNTMRWFENRGLPLKVEADNRVFPVSNRSQDVIDLFLYLAERYRVQLRTQARVQSIQAEQAGFKVTVDGLTEAFDVCILATGYSPPGWKLAEALGHGVITPVPSLFPFAIQAPVIAGLQGLSVSQARGRLLVPGDASKKKLEAEGPLLITHTGLSGPLIYRLSAWGAKALAQSQYQAQLQLDLLPEFSEDELRAELQTLLWEVDGRKKLANTGFSALPQRLWLSLLAAGGVDLDLRADCVTKKALNRLVEQLKRLSLPVTGKSPSKEEFVSCGGVPLKAVDVKTMESRRVPGLYFGGEILNIDGLTGGFNFQACWSAGWAISEALKDA